MGVVEKVFYTEDRSVLENEKLKLLGYKYESASTIGIEKPGFYIIIKADEDEFKKEEVKEALSSAEEIKDEEKEKILRKIKELEESTAGGLALLK